jgi:hypothetical protein
MKLNKYLPFAIIYFFLNSIGLPFGLLYTTLLSPLLYFWVLKKRKKEILFPFLILLLPFIIIHLFIVGVDLKSYFASILNLISVYIFCQAFYTFLLHCRNIDKIYFVLLIINFILIIIAIPFYFTSLYNLFWIEQFLTEGVDNFKRLKLFTYEASYYATIFIPIFFYYLLEVIFNKNKVSKWLLCLMIIIPYVFSFSLGVITVIIISLIVAFIIYFRNIIVLKSINNFIILFVTLAVPILIVAFISFPNNTLILRISNFFSGKDPSGNGRTFDAFYLSSQMLHMKNYFWGIGPGQVKIVGAEIIRDFYFYPLDYNVFAIPNAAAETLAFFGVVGFIIRIAIEIFLFFYTNVWSNFYRLLLFVFIFIYQFSGSFITNIAEYVIWILAFTEVFPQFHVSKIVKKKFHITLSTEKI